MFRLGSCRRRTGWPQHRVEVLRAQSPPHHHPEIMPAYQRPKQQASYLRRRLDLGTQVLPKGLDLVEHSRLHARIIGHKRRTGPKGGRQERLPKLRSQKREVKETAHSCSILFKRNPTSGGVHPRRARPTAQILVTPNKPCSNRQRHMNQANKLVLASTIGLLIVAGHAQSQNAAAQEDKPTP